MQAVLERSERSDHLIELALRVRDELCDLGDLLGRGLERMLGHPAADFTPAAGLRTTVQYGVIAVTAAAQVLVALVLMLTYSPLVTLVYLAIAPLYAGLLWISGIGCAPPTTRSRKHLGNTSRVWD
jgi:Flp pilus assembly protein TadB